MKMVPNAVSVKTARLGLKLSKNSPQLLFVAGIIGMGATVVLACKATLGVEEVIENTQKNLIDVNSLASESNRTETELRKEKASVYIHAGIDFTKLYGPSVVVGALSISALIGSHNILSKRNAALIAAYNTVSKSFDTYRERVRQEIGDDKEQEIYYDLAPCEIEDPVTGKKSKALKVGPNGLSMYAKIFDLGNKNYQATQEYNFFFLKCQQDYANDMLHARGHIFLNDVYDSLGMDRTQEGSVVGWVSGAKGGDNYVDFGVFDGPGSDRLREFMDGGSTGVWLDFNVDGVVWNLI